MYLVTDNVRDSIYECFNAENDVPVISDHVSKLLLLKKARVNCGEN